MDSARLIRFGPLCLFIVSALLLSPLDSGAASQRRVAVLDFGNSSRDPAMEWLGPAIAETLTTKLHVVRDLQLVERLHLAKIVQEQKFSASDLVDPSQVVKIGKLLGADQVVLGAYVAYGAGIRITARFVDVATGAVIATSQADGVLDARNPQVLFATFDRLAAATLDSLNTRVAIVQGVPQVVAVPREQRIEPTPEERSRLARPPTNSLAALEAFGKALVADRRYDWSEAVARYEEAVQLDPDHLPSWYGLARTRRYLGQLAAGLIAAERALHLARAEGRDDKVADVRLEIGAMYWSMGRYPEALRSYDEGRRAAERDGDPNVQARVLQHIGSVFAMQARHGEAQAYYERALRLWEQSRDEKAMSDTLTSLGFVMEKSGDPKAALEYLERSLAIQERLGYEPGMAKTLTNMGSTLIDLRRHRQALHVLQRSLALSQRLGDRSTLASALNSIGVIHADQGRYNEALEYYQRALSLREELKIEPPGLVINLLNIAKTLAAVGRHREALSYADRAVALAERHGMSIAAEAREDRNKIRRRAR